MENLVVGDALRGTGKEVEGIWGRRIDACGKYFGGLNDCWDNHCVDEGTNDTPACSALMASVDGGLNTRRAQIASLGTLGEPQV